MREERCNRERKVGGLKIGLKIQSGSGAGERQNRDGGGREGGRGERKEGEREGGGRDGGGEEWREGQREVGRGHAISDSTWQRDHSRVSDRSLSRAGGLFRKRLQRV